jgi:hypothetical protein
MISLGHPSQMCWICGTAVNQENCKTDVHGNAAHKRCYAVKLALAAEAMKLGKIPPKSTSRLKTLDVGIGK